METRGNGNRIEVGNVRDGVDLPGGKEKGTPLARMIGRHLGPLDQAAESFADGAMAEDFKGPGDGAGS